MRLRWIRVESGVESGIERLGSVGRKNRAQPRLHPSQAETVEAVILRADGHLQWGRKGKGGIGDGKDGIWIMDCGSMCHSALHDCRTMTATVANLGCESNYDRHDVG